MRQLSIQIMTVMRNETFKLYQWFNVGGRFIKRQIGWFLKVIKHASLERTYYVLLGANNLKILQFFKTNISHEEALWQGSWKSAQM